MVSLSLYGNVTLLTQFCYIVAAAKAVETVYKVKPDLTREGGSIPVTLSFQDALKKNVLLLPMGRGDDVSFIVTHLDV